MYIPLYGAFPAVSSFTRITSLSARVLPSTETVHVATAVMVAPTPDAQFAYTYDGSDAVVATIHDGFASSHCATEST